MNEPAEWDLSGTRAEVYERHMVPAQFTPWAPELLDLATPRAGDRALDIACGTGAVTRLLAQQVGTSGKVVGLDLNPDMLFVARGTVEGPNVEWREANALALPFADASFNVVICQQGLQFFPDRRASLREMRRVLAPGGRLVLAVWRSAAEMPGYGALERALAKRVGPSAVPLPPFAFSSGRELRALVSGAGFRDVLLRAEVKMVRWPSVELMIRTVVAGAPTMLGALAEQGEAVLLAIAEEVDAEMGGWTDDTGLVFPMTNHLVSARA